MRKSPKPPDMNRIEASVKEQSKSLFVVPDKPVILFPRTTGSEFRPIEEHLLMTIEKYPGLLKGELEKTLNLKIGLNSMLGRLQKRGLVHKKSVIVLMNGRRARSYGYYPTKPYLSEKESTSPGS